MTTLLQQRKKYQLFLYPIIFILSAFNAIDQDFQKFGCYEKKSNARRLPWKSMIHHLYAITRKRNDCIPIL